MVSKRATVDADEVKFATFDKGDDIILCGTITSKRHDIIIDSAWDVNIIGGTINSCRDLVISAANSLMVN